MAKVLVLYYSMYGHIETMAHAVAEGANRVDGVEVVVKRVPETMQAEAFAKAGGKHKTPRSPPRRSSRTMMPLSSAPRPASAICPARCAPSSTRRAGSGPPARYTASWPACSALPARAAARSRRSLLPGQRLRIMGWSLCRLATARRNCLMSPRPVVVRPMAQQRLPVGMVHVSQAMKNFQSPAIRVNTSRVLPKN